MKVTMVGVSGSGKTSFMSGLYETLGGANNLSGFSIVPTGETLEDAVLLQGSFRALSLATRNFEFPPGTSRSTLWSFDLQYYGRYVCNYEWIDYRGGILADIASENVMSDEEKQRDIEELISHISFSHAVILFVDSFLITYYENINHARFRSGADIINDIFETYNQFFPSRNLVFVIALTKADTVSSQWKVNDYAPLIERGLEIFSPLVRITRRNSKWTGGIVPVSVIGDGNARYQINEPSSIKSPVVVKTEIVRFPEPMNVGHALFFSLGQTLRLMRDDLNKSISQIERELQNALNRAGFMDDLFSALVGTRSARDLAKDLFEKRQREFHTLRQFEPYVDPLYQNAIEKVRVI